ncbi:site-specific DNA-methyltransferase [Mycolicibacterium lacusdiani]|uniref:site-specific DNA-methyltransferase n=1 Tax=Mycolicibacterium lacusdiani TaxID=2895283 RepID=UPI001F1A2FA3|nr:site-specific DNA-methyltransferase [Mycolicibacterium lacusdiani]
MADETNVLDQLIGQIQEESLRNRLAREVELLRGSRRFGLVFDRHLPESVRLVDHPIRKGIRVALRDESTAETWTVVRFTDTTRTVAVLDGEGGERPVSDLVVVREFGEPIYPGLQSIERIPNGAVDAPWHVVINGENFHALQALRSTHREKVDLIYIDPPYNTGGGDWIYNDRYVDAADRAKSSKWLSFMERRLLIARDLLKPTGVVIVAIGDDEHHRLRMLLDQVFGDQNFIANITWQGGGSSLSRFHAGGLDYMLVYCREMSVLTEGGVRWRVEKEGLQDVLDAAASAWEQSGHNSAAASRLLSAWWNRNKTKYDPGLGDNVKVDEDGTAVKVGDLGNSLYRPNLRYAITDPATGIVYEPPNNGWSFRRETMDEMIAAGRILFGGRPRWKTPLHEMSMRSVVPTFYRDRRAASQHLAKVLGTKDFPYPKDVEVIARWLSIATTNDPDAVILDFFGGTGTTVEAVLRLNAQDGGQRQAILVTNNEVGAPAAKALRKVGLHPGDEEWEARGVFESVCRPRISTVVTGTRPDGSVFSDGIAANVELFDLTYLDPSSVRRGQEFTAVAPLFWLEGGARGGRIEALPEAGWALADVYGVLFDIDALTGFAAAVTTATIDGRAPSVLFVITDSPAEYQEAVERLPVGIETVQLYEDYLSNYTINTSGSTR